MDFSKIAPYLQDPLVLVGFVLLLFFGLGRTILRAGIIPQLSQLGGYKIVSRLLLYGFILALAIIAFGFAVKYNELSKAEQVAAVRLLNQELTGDANTISELKKNTETLLNATATTSTVLRHPNIKLMSTLFPNSNTDPTVTVPASLELGRLRLEDAAIKGILTNEVEKKKFVLAANAIVGTVERTKGVVRSLADVDGTRYVISDDAWKANLPVLRKIHIVRTSDMEALYQTMKRARTNYGVVSTHCLSYLESLHEFFSDTSQPITAERLAAVLAAERLYITTITSYATSLERDLLQVHALQKVIETQLSPL